jgi:hypothetical protein
MDAQVVVTVLGALFVIAALFILMKGSSKRRQQQSTHGVQEERYEDAEIEQMRREIEFRKAVTDFYEKEKITQSTIRLIMNDFKKLCNSNKELEEVIGNMDHYRKWIIREDWTERITIKKMIIPEITTILTLKNNEVIIELLYKPWQDDNKEKSDVWNRQIFSLGNALHSQTDLRVILFEMTPDGSKKRNSIG